MNTRMILVRNFVQKLILQNKLRQKIQK